MAPEDTQTVEAEDILWSEDEDTDVDDVFEEVINERT